MVVDLAAMIQPDDVRILKIGLFSAVFDRSPDRPGRGNQNIPDIWERVFSLVFLKDFFAYERVRPGAKSSDFVKRHLSILRRLVFENTAAHRDGAKISEFTLFPSVCKNGIHLLIIDKSFR